MAAKKRRTKSGSTSAWAKRKSEPLLVEVAWEVVNQVGGIYTVLRSKIPSMTDRWSRRYCLVGPYVEDTAAVEFQKTAATGTFGQVAAELNEMGIEAHYGFWLVTGKPHVILLNTSSVFSRLHEIKYELYQDHGIASPREDDMINRCIAFGYMVSKLFEVLAARQAEKRAIIGHFHEWMAGSAIPAMRKRQIKASTVFTTHATLLGRYLATADPWFYDHLPFVNWEVDAKRFNIETQVRLERAAAHGSHVFTTVSDVTASECTSLLGRTPDVILPNGLNIQRFTALHEFQNLHRQYKEKIHQFVMGHFFPSYSFDLDNTLYMFTSGRYEYRNKGFDLTLEALARLNHRMKSAGIEKNIVAFVITRQPHYSINADALRSKAVMEEMRACCQAILDQAGEKFFTQVAMGKLPRLDDLVDDYWQLRLRRTQHAWRTGKLPIVVTHNLVDDTRDEVLNQVRASGLVNDASDKVKVIYHPDFITPSNPLFGMEYEHFVRGCHMGIFPSYYEPWGYTPLECIALGVPAITSDLSGFGSYVLNRMNEHEEHGIHMIHRRYGSFHDAAEQLAHRLFQFTQTDRRERIGLRNLVEQFSTHFDWHNLAEHYDEAHQLALERFTAEQL